MKDPSTAFDQVSGHALAPSDLRHQRDKQLAEYPLPVVRRDPHQTYQEQVFDVPDELRQNCTIPGSSHANSCSCVGPQKMSSGEVRRVSRKDIQTVQNLIERCLQRYMNRKEVVEALLNHAKIEPGFTELVWQKLEEENREFFKAYHVRLMVKHQIMIFNKLLEQQVELMHTMCPSGLSSGPVSDGSHSFPSNQNPSYYAVEHTVIPSKPDQMHHSTGPSNLINGGSAIQPNVQTADDASAHAGRMHIAPNMLLVQNSNTGMLQGTNGMAIKSERNGYLNPSTFTFSTEGNVLDAHATIRDASVASFSSTESNSQALNESYLESDIGFLGRIPRNFSFSDLSADFTSDIVGTYDGPAFQTTHTDNLQYSHGRECQGDNKLLDALSEGLSYEEFISD